MARINRDHSSPNFGPRRAVAGSVGIRHLLLHYTGMKTPEEALTRLCDPDSGVSAHYLIFEDGTIYGLVDEDQRAWHAGVGFWNGVTDINSASIGIEIVNPGHDYGYRPFPQPQIDACVELARDIAARHALPLKALLAHSDIAPSRKQDPGELFPWPELARHRIGIWPTDMGTSSASPADDWSALSRIGYAVPGGPGADILDASSGAVDVITAFQRRFRPDRIDGVLDPETSARIAAVAAAYAA